MVDRVKTGIPGLDKALMGGIPKGNAVLISGGAGTGKSTLCLQYLYNGAKMFGERGLYLSTEQTDKNLVKQASAYGWDLEELVKKNLLKFSYFDVVKGDDFLQRILQLYNTFMPKRIVIDSLTTLTDSIFVSGEEQKKPYSIVQIDDRLTPIPKTERIMSKTLLYLLLNKLKLFDSTVFMTSELPEKTEYLSADQISEFICDGVIILEYLGVGRTVFRSIRVRKMRYTDHEKGSLPYKLGTKGVEITEEEIKF